MAFTYDPLELEVGYIRLLTLQSSLDPSAEIECTITHDAINQAKYTALSYTWGSIENKQFITLNEYKFAVTKNLFLALQDLRGNEPLTIWIDAICINQEDVDERTSQVKQMVNIYQNATQVFIWIGEEIKNLDAALSLMNWCKSMMKPSGFGIEGLVHFADSEHRRDGWDALVKLLERPWWSRVWIVQEIVYGKDPVVVCGKYRFSWHLLQFFGESREIWNKITWMLYQQEKMFYSGGFVHASDRLDFICAVRAQCPISWHSLKALLWGIRASEATDPRDKVFAMLGLLRDDFQLCKVDYRASTSQVYVEAAAGILKYTESLHFLSWTHNTVGTAGTYLTSSMPLQTVEFGCSASRPAGLPSWTPSWSSAHQELLELQSFNEAGFSKEAMHEVAEQIEEHEYNLAMAEEMKKALDAHQKTENADPASLIQNLEQLMKTGPKQKSGPLYPDEAAFMRDVQNRAEFSNTANRGTAWKTLFTAPDIPNSRKGIYLATGNSLPCAKCIVEKGILRVFGTAVDVLEDVSPPCTETFPLDGPAFAWIRTVLARKLGLPVSSKETLDAGYDSDSEDKTSRSLQFYPLFWRIILADQWQGVRLKKGNIVEIPGAGTIPPPSTFVKDVGDPREHVERIVKELFEVRGAVISSENQVAYRWRALFTSKKGAGLAPIDGRKGDIVFAIFGCDVPFLVRKTEKGYLFLGECYLHGYMDGRIIRGLRSGAFKPEVLNLV